jgi:hypothetical protein
MPELPKQYCIDTSSLIYLHRYYPRPVFASLWTHCEGLILNGRLFAPREVLRELERKDDAVRDWAASAGPFFVETDGEQLQFVEEILATFPRLIDHTKETPDADPFVVALARARRGGLAAADCHVVTDETWAGPGGVKMPNVCGHFGVPCVRLADMFQLETWAF